MALRVRAFRVRAVACFFPWEAAVVLGVGEGHSRRAGVARAGGTQGVLAQSLERLASRSR